MFSRKPLTGSVLAAMAESAANLATLIERSRAEGALLAQNIELQRAIHRSQQVIEWVPNGILVVDPTGAITLANTPAMKMFGYESAELIGQPVEILLPKALRAAHPGHRTGFFSDPHARAMGTGRDLFAVRKDGSEFPVEVQLNLVGLRLEHRIAAQTSRHSTENARCLRSSTDR